MDPIDAIFQPALEAGYFSGVSVLARDAKGKRQL